MSKTKEYTVTFTVEVTKVFKDVGVQDPERFLKEEYPEIVRKRIRNDMGFDNVSPPKNYKVFVRDEDEP